MFPTFLLNPWVLLGAILVVASSCSTGYVAGRKHEANKWKAEQAEQLQAQIRERQQLEAMGRAIVEKSQKKDAEIAELHRRINREITKNTDGRECFGAGAVRVWNDAFKAAGVSEDSGRASGADPVSDANSGATDEQVLRSANEVGKLLNMCRERIERIREWDQRKPKE